MGERLVDYGLFDADQHYYEADDAFTRYASQRKIMRDNALGLVPQ